MSTPSITTPLPEMLRMLAGIVVTAELNDGRRIRDASDAKDWLYELAEAAERKEP